MATPGHSHSSGLPKAEKKIGPFPESAVKVGVLKLKIVSSQARVVCLPPHFFLQQRGKPSVPCLFVSALKMALNMLHAFTYV